MNALRETTETLEYLIMEFDNNFGRLDHINMQHARAAAAIGRATLPRSRPFDFRRMNAAEPASIVAHGGQRTIHGGNR